MSGVPSTDQLQDEQGFRPLMRTLRREFRGYGRNMAFCGGLTGLASCCDVVVAFLIAGVGSGLIKGIDEIDVQFGIHLPIHTAAVLALAIVTLRAALDIVAAWYRTRFIARYEYESRRAMLGSFLDAEWEVQAAEDTGNMQTTMVSYLAIGRDSLSKCMDTITAALAFVLLMTGTLAAGRLWVLAIGVGAGLLAFSLKPFVGMAYRAGLQYRKALLKFNRTNHETYTMAREIRLFGADAHMLRRISDDTADLADGYRRSQVASSFLSSVQQSATYFVGAAGLLLLVALDVKKPEPFVVVVLLAYKALGNSKTFQGSYQALLNNGPSLVQLQITRRRYAEAAIPTEGVEFEPPLTEIEFSHVDFSYEPGDPALRDASFTIKRGEALGLVGPSGSGKSTIVQLLLRLREPDGGAVLVNGTDLKTIRPRSWFGHAVLVAQEASLFGASVYDNVTSFREGISEADVRDALRRAHVLDEIEALPDGLRTVVGEAGRALSGGQRQRVCIARALAGTPDVLILDEPTSALDLISEEAIRATLEELRGTMTIVIIAHRLSTLRVCDSVMVLEGGRIKAAGKREDLEAEGGFYADAVQLAKLV